MVLCKKISLKSCNLMNYFLYSLIVSTIFTLRGLCSVFEVYRDVPLNSSRSSVPLLLVGCVGMLISISQLQIPPEKAQISLDFSWYFWNLAAILISFSTATDAYEQIISNLSPISPTPSSFPFRNRWLPILRFFDLLQFAHAPVSFFLLLHFIARRSRRRRGRNVLGRRRRNDGNSREITESSRANLVYAKLENVAPLSHPSHLIQADEVIYYV
ncbi:unnamed protein product, partial [Mesorhabditis belari]|uniref:Uncharacterized protein n=1 Tax=Mesorhabditis belari TaxID=2138241 RepID=A0AAF3EBH3_9BILA